MEFVRNRRIGYILLQTTAVVGLLCPSIAYSQDANDTIVLDRLTVGGTAPAEDATGPVEGYVANRTTAGAKTGTPIEEVPQSVSVIGREEMDDRGAEKADEALRYTAGVFAQPFGADTDTNWLYIRGFDATQTGVYQDGLALYSYGFGGLFVDSFTLERIEVLRGASSVLYGASNPGGLVNYVSKLADGRRVRHVETGINDAGNAHLGFDIGDRFNEKLDYRVVGRIAGGDTYSDHADGMRGTLQSSLRIRPTDDTSLTLFANYTDIDESHVGGAFLPYVGSVVDAPFGKIDPDANFTEPGSDEYRRRQVSVGYRFEHAFDDTTTFRQNTRYTYADIHEVSIYPYGYNGFSATPTDPDNLLSRINFEHQSEVNSFLIDNQLEKKVATGPVDHTFLVGVDYRYYRLDQVQLSGSATPISATDPVYGAVQGERSPYIDQVLTLNQVGAYLQDQMRFGQGWIVTLNGRYDHVSTEADGNPEYEGDDGKLSGRAGLAYEFANGITPYASVSTFFNPVLGSSAVAGVYKPETGHQVEVGVKYLPDWIDGIFTVALFDLTRKNVVTGPFLGETQIGEVNSQGVEVEAKVDITPNLRGTAAFTALDLEITEDANEALTGNTPYLVPETQASASLDYTFRDNVLDGVVVGGGVRYVGSSWADNENTLKVPSATVFDARIGYAKDNWGADLFVTNLFDKEYVASCQTQYSCAYAEGRVVKLNLHMTW
ncbi:TonB-dependent siderophore receptor [Azospirillum sp. ST 5-10]|uniref:TonB-dependent siderophore receptor n=1 Tax=unclassified Azospirillum TaxID=2630922 RepID=UPI003F4A2F3C